MKIYGHSIIHCLRAVFVTKNGQYIALDGFVQVRKTNSFTDSGYGAERLWLIKDMVKRR